MILRGEEMNALEIINWNNVERLRRADDVEVFVQFRSSQNRLYRLKTPQEAEDMMKDFASWCVLGLPKAGGAYVIYEDKP